MHYAVFWLFKSHIQLHYKAKNGHFTGESAHTLPVITACPFWTEEILSRLLVIVVLVLDVVYGLLMSLRIKGRISDPTGSCDPYLFSILQKHSPSTYEYNTAATKIHHGKTKKSLAVTVAA